MASLVHFNMYSPFFRLAYYAYRRKMEFIESLPKTRSGKIMRRVLKAKELGQPLGDVTMLDE